VVIKLRFLFIIVVCVVVELHASPVLATTVEEPGLSAPGAIITSASTVLMLTNAVLWAQDGSVLAGTAGIIFGVAQIGFVLATDARDYGEFAAFSVVVGLLGVATGSGSMHRGLQRRGETRHAIEMTPAVNMTRQFVGLQLIARW
jgi:hypothetical protein